MFLKLPSVKISSFLFLIGLASMLFSSNAIAATITSATSGNWSAGTTWVGGVAPTAADNAVIAAGHTVTVTSSASVTNLTLNNLASKLVIEINQTLTVTGTFTNSGTTTNGVNGPGTIRFTGGATFGILTQTGTRPNIIIGDGNSTNTVTVSATTLISNLSINIGATLNSNSRTLTIGGDFVNNGTVTLTTGQMNVTAGSFSNSGAITLTTGQINVSAGTTSSTGSLTYTGAGFLRLGGNLSYSGTFSLGSAAVLFTGNVNQSIPSFTTTGTVSMTKTGGTATFTGNVNGGGLTINGVGGTLSLMSGTHTFSGAWTRTAGILDCGSSLLKIGASTSGSVATFIAGTGTVEYYSSVGQTVAPVVYNNLTLSGSGTKTLTGTTINNLLSMEGVTIGSGTPSYGPAASLRYNYTDIRTVGTEWVTPFTASGGVSINGNQITTLNGNKVFNAGIPLTINTGAILAAGIRSLTLGGNFINNGGFFTSTGAVVIANTMANQSIAGFTTTGLVSMTKTSGTATFIGNVNGAGLTINGAGGTLHFGTALSHTFTGAVALAAGTLNASSSTLNANFTGTAWTGTGTNFIAGTGTVNFGGVAQTLTAATIFNNLIFSNSGLKTLTGAQTVNGVLSLEGAATVSAIPIYGSSATLQYNRVTNQTAGPEWVSPFTASGGVRVINVGIITANSTKTFGTAAPLLIDSGATLDNGGFALSGSSTISVVDTGTLQLSGTSTFPTFSTTILGLNSAVDYLGTAQNVAIVNYGDLLLSGSGNKTFAGVTTIGGDFLISDTAVALLFNSTASSTGTLTLGGELQTTLGSYGGTTSTATNTNDTWFGSTTTGTINVSNSCVPGTWLGLVNTDWNNAMNWCSGMVPTASSNVIIGPTANQPTIGAAGGFCRNITIKIGATLTVSGSNLLTVAGSWTNNGNFISNASTVRFNGTASQLIGGINGTVFNHFTNANTVATIIAGAAITVKNILSMASTASILDMGIYQMIDGGTFLSTGTGQIKTASTSLVPLPSGKIWSGSLIYSNVTGGQTIVGGTFNGIPSIELKNTSGTQLASGNIATGGQFNINNGGNPIFDLNGFNLNTQILNISAPNAILDMRTGALSYGTLLSMEGTVRFSGATNGRNFTSGTVEYYGTAQTVKSGSYYDLVFSGASGVYAMASDIDVANTLKVTGGSVSVQSGFTLSVDNAVTVVSPGTLTIENNATLLQTTYTGPNFGNVIVKRNTTPVLRFDTTFWSSPTTGTQTLFDFAPQTDLNRFNGYNSVTDTYTTLNANATVFSKGVGYSIRCPVNTSTTVATIIPYQFIGVPNNGSFTIPLATPPADTGLSLVGNPYASSLNVADFINENLYNPTSNPTNVLSGTYYLWSHNTRLIGNDFSSDNYYTCNLSGAVGFTLSGTGNNTPPSGFIASGQGFFVENQIAGDLKFDNTMRETKNNTNFYKIKKSKSVEELERHRIYLDIIDSAVTTGSQALVGYIENATDDFDFGYDSYLFDSTRPLLIYSMLGSDALAINGKALPFVDTDTFSIGYSTKIADNITISINRVDGLFEGDQPIFLEDKVLGIMHDLRAKSYTFASAAGAFNNRFVLNYTGKTLGTTNFSKANNDIFISKYKNELKIKSGLENIQKVVVFDILGKKVFEKTAINSTEYTIAVEDLKNQVGIVKVYLVTGEVISRKVVF
jgi:hypothetical protein